MQDHAQCVEVEDRSRSNQVSFYSTADMPYNVEVRIEEGTSCTSCSGKKKQATKRLSVTIQRS